MGRPRVITSVSLVMGGQTSIARTNRPAVAPLHGATGASADQRLDRQHQALRPHVRLVGIPLIGNRWWLVNPPPDPVPGHTLHPPEALTPHPTLSAAPNLARPTARPL